MYIQKDDVPTLYKLTAYIYYILDYVYTFLIYIRKKEHR